MSDKIESANRIIELTLARYARPAVMSSFGKDSMVLLHLVRQVRESIDVIFHREAFCPEKYAFANGVIEKWNLHVYDFPPEATGLIERNGHLEIANFYSAGDTGGLDKTLVLPTGILDDPTPQPLNPRKGAWPPRGFTPSTPQPLLCGRYDLLDKPKAKADHPWDLLYVGHKSSDVDPIQGAVPLHLDVKTTHGMAALAFPLRHWSDADIWAYTLEHELPIHTSRYEAVAVGYPPPLWRERQDKRFNPDYFPVCTRCIDRRNPKFVQCPRLGGLEIDNVSSQVIYWDAGKLDYFGVKEQAAAA